MAAPIVSDEKVIGVIRCSVPKQGPYYFSGRDLDLLKLVASQIAGYWANWLVRRESREEILSWQALVNSIGKLNSSFTRNSRAKYLMRVVYSLRLCE